MFATLQVPERDSPIIAATGEPAAIGAHLECMHRALMGFSHLYALPAVNIPPAQHSVTASTDELLPTWTPGHCNGHPRTPCRLAPQANCCPSGLQAIAKKTVSGWSGSWCLSTQAPEVGFHSRMVLSHPLLASNLPLGLHPTAETTPRCPRNTRGGLAPVISQTVTSASEPPLASWVPSGLQSIPKREDT